MIDHGLLFTADMVRALVARHKTETRRLPHRMNCLVDGRRAGPELWKRINWKSGWTYVDRGFSPAGNAGPYLHIPEYRGDIIHRVYPNIQKGDRIWVKETWKPDPAFGQARIPTSQLSECDHWLYRATLAPSEPKYGTGSWRSSMLMPKKVARLWLDVVEVDIQRLQDIDCLGAWAEGTPDVRTIENNWDLRDCYKRLWNQINAEKASWNQNPWVFVYKFKLMSSLPVETNL